MFVTYCSKKHAMQHKKDVGKILTPFRLRLKPNTQIIPQFSSKAALHYSDNLNGLLKEFEKHKYFEHIGSPHDEPISGNTNINPLIISKETSSNVY